MGGEVRKVQWIGRRGAPDRLVMLPEVRINDPAAALPPVSVWVELKAPGRSRPSPPAREHERMRRMGQRVEVIDSIEAWRRCSVRDFEPRPYQQIALAHLLDVPRCALWAGMGMGKTCSTLAALDALALVESHPTLVLAPLRVARDTWPAEARKWRQFKRTRDQPHRRHARRARGARCSATCRSTRRTTSSCPGWWSTTATAGPSGRSSPTSPPA
jgi:hypothetical protein